jgi:molybdopterin converting factor small subunit
MQVTVYVPAALRQFAAGQRQLRLEVDEPATVGRVFARLHASAPGVVERALDEHGGVRQHVNVFVDGQSIRLGGALGLETPVAAGAEVWIIPAVSGGGL